MNTPVNELMNNSTLAPIKEFYEPKNLGNNDAQMLATIAKSSISSIEAAVGAITHLISNLKTYKQCMIDSINLQAESADISTKYAINAPSQSHTLPGVISTPQAYDLHGIKSDNERMEQVKADKDKTFQQKRIYLRLAEEDIRVFLQAWKRLQYSDASFEEFIEVLNNSINQHY